MYRHELSVVVLEKENEQLCEELQCCVQDCETLQKENKFVKTQMSVSVSKQPQQQASPFLQRTTDRRYSKGHERRLKRSRAQHCDLSLGWLGRQGYTLTKVEAVNNQTSETELVYQTKEDLQCVSGSDSDSLTVSEDDVDTLNMLLFVKDRYCISGEAYHELTKICKSLPRTYKLKELITELNQKWNIFPTPEGTIGVQQSLKERLELRVAKLIAVSPLDDPFQQLKKSELNSRGMERTSENDCTS